MGAQAMSDQPITDRSDRSKARAQYTVPYIEHTSKKCWSLHRGRIHVLDKSWFSYWQLCNSTFNVMVSQGLAAAVTRMAVHLGPPAEMEL